MPRQRDLVQRVAVDGFAATFSGGWKPSIKSFAIEQAIRDYLLSLVFENMFERFPNCGSPRWRTAHSTCRTHRQDRSTSNKMPGYWKDDPIDTFRRHVWINPFWEDDVNQVADCMGPERVIFGSDWPHIEALPEPSTTSGSSRSSMRRTPAASSSTTSPSC